MQGSSSTVAVADFFAPSRCRYQSETEAKVTAAVCVLMNCLLVFLGPSYAFPSSGYFGIAPVCAPVWRSVVYS